MNKPILAPKDYAPIVLFTYARLEHTKRTIDALLKNDGYELHDLIIFSDAARMPSVENDVYAVREYLKTISGFRTVTIHYRPYNFGLAKSIIEGVTEVISERDKIIVLEDDMVTSPYFLSYMDESLDRFKDDDRIISIHGYIYPVCEKLPETFFLPGADCWGWATWKRGWALFNPDGRSLLDQLKQRHLIKKFDFGGANYFAAMLEGQIKGENNSWAIRWYASAFLANKLTLYPGKSLVNNIGNDGSGSHGSQSNAFEVSVSQTPVKVNDIEVKVSTEAYKAFQSYWFNQHSFLRRLLTSIFGYNNYIRLALAKKGSLFFFNRVIKRLTNSRPYFLGPYDSWLDAKKQSRGYDDPAILDKVFFGAINVRFGRIPYERDSVVFQEIQYSWQLLTTLLLSASTNEGNLSVLDFGGGLGTSYFQNIKFLKNLIKVHWGIVEQRNFVEVGKRYMEDNSLKFYLSVDDFLNVDVPQIALFSSVLQYLEFPYDVINSIKKFKPRFIVLDRTIVNATTQDSIYIQQVPDTVYFASYPCRSFSEKNILNSFSPEYSLMVKFESLPFPILSKISSSFSGYILERVIDL